MKERQHVYNDLPEKAGRWKNVEMWKCGSGKVAGGQLTTAQEELTWRSCPGGADLEELTWRS